MIYHVITSENYSSISTITEAARLDILNRYKVDNFDNYVTVHFLIAGEEAIQQHLNETGTTVSGRDEIKVKEGTGVNVLPCTAVSWSFDARTKHGGWSGWCSIIPLVEVNGIKILGICHKGKFTFKLQNDDIRHYDYLSYNWGQEHPQPNRVGTLTDKNAQAWAEWLTLRNETAKAIKAERENKVAGFLARVRKASEGCKDSYISEKHGRMFRGGLKFSYQIANNGVISSKIDIDILSDLMKGDYKLTAFEHMTGRA